MLKQAHPEWGCQRISDMLARGPALAASATSVARVLHEAGYEAVEEATRRHPDRVRSFEREAPHQLWQTDLFSFVLKRQNRRLYLVAFLDDHSRFITGFGLHASQSAALVLEVLRASLASYHPPMEILTDNGAQYVTWRGKSQFSKELEKRGIKQLVARPRRPQTLGKIERFWGTLWRECVESSIFLDLADARQRIGLFIDYYNFQRPHQGIGGLVPADRFFEAAPEVLQTMKDRVAANALELARNGVPKKPFYLTGQLDGKPFSVHREGDRVILRQAGQEREEIDLPPPPESGLDARQETVPAEPGGAAGVVEPVAEPPATGSSGETDEQRLPVSICPDGSPQTAWRPPDAVPLPGVSAVDGVLEQLAARNEQAMAAAEVPAVRPTPGELREASDSSERAAASAPPHEVGGSSSQVPSWHEASTAEDPSPADADEDSQDLSDGPSPGGSP
jgi:transposase InsO family protein